MKLKGKVALVTGGSQGIGRAIAIKLADEGADVVVNYHSHPEKAEQTVAEIEKLNKGKCFASKGDATYIQSDVSEVDKVRSLVNSAIDHFGQLDILVNNAGVEKETPFLEVAEEDYDLVMDTNLKGAFFSTQEFSKYLIKNKRTGKIVNISSVHEELPFPNYAPYCLSKGGMKMMTRNLAVELGEYGITINNVAPGAIKTPINKDLLNDSEKVNALLNNIPLNRMGEPNDVSSLVAFLCSDDAAYITGATFFVDGGLLWNYKE